MSLCACGHCSLSHKLYDFSGRHAAELDMSILSERTLQNSYQQVTLQYCEGCFRCCLFSKCTFPLEPKKVFLVPVHFSFSSNLNRNVQPCEKGSLSFSELMTIIPNTSDRPDLTAFDSHLSTHNCCDCCGRLSNPTPQKQLLLPPNCSPRLSWPPEHRYRSLTSQACAALNCIHY